MLPTHLHDNLLKVYDTAIDEINAERILPEMYATEALPKRFLEDLDVEKVRWRKNMKLLDCIMKSSLYVCQQFINALHNAGQTHIADAIEQGIPIKGNYTI